MIGDPILTPEDLSELKRAYTETDETVVDIAKRIGATRSALSYWIKKMGIYDPNRGKRIEGQNKLIADEYRNGNSVSDICRKFGLASPTIYRIFKKEGVKTDRDRPIRTKDFAEKRGITKEQFVAEFNRTNNVYATAEKYGCGYLAVLRYLKRCGINLPKSTRREDMKDQICGLYASGETVPNISKITGVAVGTIDKWFLKWNVERNREAKFKKLMEKHLDEEVISKYREFRTITDTAKHYGVPVKNIAEILSTHGIDGNDDRFTQQEKGDIVESHKRGETLRNIGKRYKMDAHTIRHALDKWGIPRLGEKNHTMCHRKNISEDEIVASFDELGCLEYVAEKFRTSVVTVRKIIRKYNRKSSQEIIGEFVDKHKEYIINSYNKGICGHDIAKDLGVSNSPIYKALADWGVVFRENHGYNTSIERRMKEILESIGIPYKFQFVIHFGKTKKDRYVYDFILPDYNLIIEVHGDYWHANPEMFSTLNEIQQKSRQRDTVKAAMAKERGHGMFVVWENEIASDPGGVAERLLSILCPDYGLFS